MKLTTAENTNIRSMILAGASSSDIVMTTGASASQVAGIRAYMTRTDNLNKKAFAKAKKQKKQRPVTTLGTLNGTPTTLVPVLPVIDQNRPAIQFAGSVVKINSDVVKTIIIDNGDNEQMIQIGMME